jgi:HSP20 family molecular chaperone IbpA
MSELIPSGKKSSVTSSSSSSFSSSSSSSASSSSSSKVVKQSSSSVKSSSSLQSSSSTSSASTSSSSKSIGIKSKGDSYIDRIGSDFGIDAGREVERLKLKMSEEMSNIHQDMFQLISINSPEANKTVVHLDSDSLRSCIDKSNNDRLKLNFDVNEFESESINIKTVGNKIEVHAKKKSKKGDEERNEEFSRVYELPTQNAVDAGNVTSSIYKDGVLTIELPVADAIAGTDLSLSQFGHGTDLSLGLLGRGTDLSLGQLGQTGSSVKSACERTSTSYTTSSSSKSIGIKNSGQSYLDRISSDFGIDVGKELDQLKLKVSEDLAHSHKDIFQLLPTTPDIESSVVRLDSDSLRSCIDKAHNDRLKLNFDVNEFESESINIQTVGNKIEVHAKKKSKKGDEERNEEFSRVYELPTQNAVDAANVTSSIYNDGVLTIELPVADAIAGTDLSLSQFGLGSDLSLGLLGRGTDLSLLGHGTDLSLGQLGQTGSSVKSACERTSSSFTSSSSSKFVGIKNSGQSYLDRISSDFGIDMGKEMEQLKLRMSEDLAHSHKDIFQLLPASSGDIDKSVVRLDSDSFRSCIDKAHNDRLKLNFDVNEFESESINIKTVGNKIEVHAKKKSKKGDEERNEEFTRVYELPTQNAVDAANVTSSIYKDGVLTIELPVADAIAGTDFSF